MFPGQGGKVTFHVTTIGSPAEVVKKQAGVGRGAPPPVPPNKPVVPPKKDTILGRRGESTLTGEEQKPPQQTVKFGITVSKENSKVVHPSGATEGQVGPADPTCSVARLHDADDLEFNTNLQQMLTTGMVIDCLLHWLQNVECCTPSQ